jgi:hypothetical protein
VIRAAVPVFGYKSHRTLTGGTGNPDLDRDRRRRARQPQIDGSINPRRIACCLIRSSGLEFRGKHGGSGWFCLTSMIL